RKVPQEGAAKTDGWPPGSSRSLGITHRRAFSSSPFRVSSLFPTFSRRGAPGPGGVVFFRRGWALRVCCGERRDFLVALPAGGRPMSPRLSLLLALGFAPALQAGAPRADRHGDPLPAGALARLGTVRLREGGAVRALALAPDGKTVASAAINTGPTHLWDAASGKEVHQVGGPARGCCLACSPHR